MTDEFPRTFDGLLAVMLPDRPHMMAVMDGFRGLLPEAKAQAFAWALARLEAHDEDQEDPMIIAAQGIVALLPTTLRAVLTGLRGRNEEVRFSLIVALEGLPRRTLDDLQATLLPAVWDSAETSEDTSVEVVAVDFFRVVPKKALRREIASRDLSDSSDFFLWSLRREHFPRKRWPRNLGREIYRREAARRKELG